jgi:hypothetical protein
MGNRVKNLALLLALASPLAAEPPTGPYLLAVAATSRTDGVVGPQWGVAAGSRISISEYVNMLAEGSAMVSDKIGLGGQHYAASFALEWHRGPWYASAGAAWAVQVTPEYSKQALAPVVRFGRGLGPVWLTAVWRARDDTENEVEAIGVELEARHGRGRLRVAFQWVKDVEGGGLRVVLGVGVGRR